jgi:hypothetical protein
MEVVSQVVEALPGELALAPPAELREEVAEALAAAVRASAVVLAVEVRQAPLAAGQMFITGSTADLKITLHPARSRNFILTGGLTGTPTLQPPRLILN